MVHVRPYSQGPGSSLGFKEPPPPQGKERSTKRSTRIYEKVHYIVRMLKKNVHHDAAHDTVEDLTIQSARAYTLQNHNYYEGRSTFLCKEPTCRITWLRLCTCALIDTKNIHKMHAIYLWRTTPNFQVIDCKWDVSQTYPCNTCSK